MVIPATRGNKFVIIQQSFQHNSKLHNNSTSGMNFEAINTEQFIYQKNMSDSPDFEIM